MKFSEETRIWKELHLRKIKEGNTEIFVPDPMYYRKSRDQYLPSSLPVFYNPQMTINRDISLLALSAYTKQDRQRKTYLEGLAASGIRGFRVNKELKEKIKVLLNDANQQAVELIKYNKSFVDADDDIQVFNHDFNFLCHKLKRKGEQIDAVEVDPFGTPGPFLHSALTTSDPTEALLIVTATDLTVLRGKYPNVALRKYGSKIIEASFSKEIGLRALLYSIMKTAGIMGRTIDPLFSFFFDNFAKVGVLVKESRSEANKAWENVGWSYYCPTCDAFWVKKGFPPSTKDLPPLKTARADSHEDVLVAGPLWIRPLFDEAFLESMRSSLEEVPIQKQNAWKLSKAIRRERKGKGLPFYYDVNKVAQRFSLPSPKIIDVIEEIKSAGYEAHRTHFEATGVKTDADVRTVEDAVKKCTGENF